MLSVDDGGEDDVLKVASHAAADAGALDRSRVVSTVVRVVAVVGDDLT